MKAFLFLTTIFILSCSSASSFRGDSYGEKHSMPYDSQTESEEIRIYVLNSLDTDLSFLIDQKFKKWGENYKASILKSFENGIEFYQYKDETIEILVNQLETKSLKLSSHLSQLGDEPLNVFVYEPIDIESFCKQNKILIDKNSYLLCLGKISLAENSKIKKNDLGKLNIRSSSMQNSFPAMKFDFLDAELDYVLMNTKNHEAVQLGTAQAYIQAPELSRDEIEDLGQKTLNNIIENILFLD